MMKKGRAFNLFPPKRPPEAAKTPGLVARQEAAPKPVAKEPEPAPKPAAKAPEQAQLRATARRPPRRV